MRFVELVPDSHCLVSVGDDATVRLWDLTRLDERAVVLRGHEHPISALAVDSSRRRLVTGDERGRVLVWRLWDPGRDPAARLQGLIDLALRTDR